MINIFKRGHKTLVSDIDTWVVRWNYTYGSSRYPDFKETAQFFTSKEEAKEFAEALKRANDLIGNTNSYMNWIKCEKAENKGLKD